MNEHEIQFSSVGQRLREERLPSPRVAPSSRSSLGQSGWNRYVKGCGSNDRNCGSVPAPASHYLEAKC